MVDAVRLRRDLTHAGTFLAAIFVVGTLSVALTPEGGAVSVWWPAAGLSVAALVTASRRARYPLVVGIAVLTFLANLAEGRDVPVAAGFGVANALEALVVSQWIQPGDERPELRTQEDRSRLLDGTIVGTLLLGVLVATTVQLSGTGEFLTTMLTVTASHAAAILVIVPLAMRSETSAEVREARLELAAQTAALLGATVFVFYTGQRLPISFLVMPALAWGALRFGVRVTSWQLIGVALIATTMSSQGWGPFAPGPGSAVTSFAATGPLVQAFVICGALITLPLAIAVAQRQTAIALVSQREEFTRAVLDTAECYILVVRLDGVVDSINPALSRSTGVESESVVGRPLWETLVPADAAVGVEEMFAHADGSAMPTQHETDLATATGGRRRVEWSNAFITDDEGHATHVVMTGIDRTRERSADELVRHILQAPTNTALIGVDENGTITVVNAGALEMLGGEATDLVGRPFVEAVMADPREAPTEFASLVEAHGGPHRTVARDWSWRRHNGTLITVSQTLGRVRDTFDDPIGYLVVGRNVTEQRRSQELLMAALDKERQAVSQLRHLDSAKNEFVSTVSHELRTPITSIVGYVEMIQDGAAGEVTPDLDRLLGAVHRNGRRLMGLANDLLTLSEFESGTFRMSRNHVDLREVVRHCQEAATGLTANRSLELEFAVPDEPVATRGDAGHLERALLNLLSNAVKFTDDDGRVSLTLRREQENAVIEVADTGLGIPEDEQARLFTRFFRSSTAQHHAIQGTGLGLSIVDSVVRAHGGTIGVRSAHMRGTVFTITLPIDTTTATSAAGDDLVRRG